jgi:hypothetical protein
MTSDYTVKFLLECGWEFNKSRGFSHWKLTDEEEFMSIEEAMAAQEYYDPSSIEDYKMMHNLNSKQAHMYSEYLDS